MDESHELAGEHINNELMKALREGDQNKFNRFLMAALGVLPWVGGVISGGASVWAENEQGRINILLQQWLAEHEEDMRRLKMALGDIVTRLQNLDHDVQERIQSDEYLGIVRKAFRVWDNADTDVKRKLIQNLLAHAAASRICSDDVITLFIKWINDYHETHFKIIKVIYQTHQRGIGRGAIWDQVYGSRVREDSAEADLYKLLIRDMSTGSIIRQFRETTGEGQFVKKRAQRTGRSTMKSAFDNNDPYVLTELGLQFVHYTMDELVPRIASNSQSSDAKGV